MSSNIEPSNNPTINNNHPECIQSNINNMHDATELIENIFKFRMNIFMLIQDIRQQNFDLSTGLKFSRNLRTTLHVCRMISLLSSNPHQMNRYRLDTYMKFDGSKLSSESRGIERACKLSLENLKSVCR